MLQGVPMTIRNILPPSPHFVHFLQLVPFWAKGSRGCLGFDLLCWMPRTAVGSRDDAETFTPGGGMSSSAFHVSPLASLFFPEHLLAYRHGFVHAAHDKVVEPAHGNEQIHPVDAAKRVCACYAMHRREVTGDLWLTPWSLCSTVLTLSWFSGSSFQA